MRKETILLTGATGAFGSMLLPRLVAKGYRIVCIVRCKLGEHPSERLSGYDPRQVVAIRGDITADQCGISAADVELWKHQISFMLHNAASISFTDEVATSIANIEGVKNALELAERLGIQSFRHVSTAYIAGDSESFNENESLVGQRWRNGYESSKHIGETIVRAWGLAHPDRRFDIFRPSILIGNEKDATTTTYDAYFGYFRPIDAVANALRHRTKGLPDGVSVSNDGTVRLPVVLVASARSTLNLIPIDWAADMLVAGLSMPSANKVYHLVHPHPPLVRDVIRWSLEALQVTGVSIASTTAEKASLTNTQPPRLASLQRTIDKTLDQYIPYTTESTRFQSVVTQLALGNRYREPIIVDKEFLRKLLGHAKDMQWGSRRTTLTPAE